MSEWSLRLSRASDAEILPAIESAAGQLFADDPDLAKIDVTETWTASEHRKLISKGHCLTALVGDDIVGFLTTEPFRRELHIWEMSVHPSHQKSGIGAGLLRACMIDARNSGFVALTLTTFRDIAWNAPFYARLGFTEIADPQAHPRLAETLAEEVEDGLPRTRRCAMIHFLE
ncbi:GNAT family N-acetyltransferase [Pontixanthobacter gangjinensis]|uniref:GNAT family N-acetyltransferase n=1 Tax=Pontixanthobacter gangjinensis TaxID=1028742 RepID=A0A6I4SLY2_9SPHN|nr:GNAT family N-acetyltransferase [Pontixanthobacter gangjinensis]MXO56130.1 GNAT family N-acetyltransferase [Pontixanthobacter gangjinensis]